MLKTSISASILGLLLASTTVYANDTLSGANDQIGALIGGQVLSYEEFDPTGTRANGIADSENGGQLAFGAFLSHEGDIGPFANVYEKLSATDAVGKTDYQGALVNIETLAQTPYRGTDRSHMSDISFKLGQGFSSSPEAPWQIVPYLAYTYHSWLRSIPGYQENYYDGAFGPGLLGQLALGDFTFSLDLQHAVMLGAKQTSALAAGTIRLGNSSTSTAVLGADYALTRNGHLLFSYEANYFRYGISPPVPYADSDETGSDLEVFEPSSKTIQQLIFVGYGYQY